jgi:hypothetical protein
VARLLQIAGPGSGRVLSWSRTETASCRAAERGPVVVHTVEIDVTVPRTRSGDRGVDGECVDNLPAPILLPGPVGSTWSGTFGLGAPFPAPRTDRPSPRRSGRGGLSLTFTSMPSAGSGLRWGNYRTPWLRGRPSPARGHAGLRRARPCRVPTQLSCGPVPRPHGEHGQVALCAAGRSRPQGPGGQGEHLAAQPRDRSSSHPATAEPQRAKRGPAQPRTGGHTLQERGEAGGRASPTDRPEARSRIAPSPPTRAARAAMIRSNGCPGLSPRP